MKQVSHHTGIRDDLATGGSNTWLVGLSKARLYHQRLQIIMLVIK